jgi:signal transduction histidine kinase
MENFRLSQRLVFRQTRNSILVALSLGIFISIIQIFSDFNAEQKRIDETVLQVLNTTRESAAQAAYSLNGELALRVVKGLFEYQPIYSAELIDDFGRKLASLERPPTKHEIGWIGPLIRTDKNEYNLTLYLNGTETVIGEIRVLVDRILIAEDFISRAGVIILTGILRNFVLAIFFGYLFYYTLGRPVMQTIKELSRVDPAQPANTHIDVPDGHQEDELGLLVRKLNAILTDFDDTLQQRYMAEEELLRNEKTIKKLNQRLEERVRTRTSELEVANKEMEAFTYSVSHDLRAPLRTIGGFSQILQEEYVDQLDDQAKHYLDRVLLGAQKMEGLINDLLKLSRSTRGDMHRQDINLSILASEITQELSAEHKERNVTITIQPDVMVYADKRFMRVVLENLLSNAWKYSQNIENARIEIGQLHRQNEDVFFVRDNGAGFDMNYADKLFAPFQRLHSAKEFEGTGVGLATVQRIIFRHGGEVWAEAEINKGATFYFTLPRPILEEPQPQT